MGIKFFSLVSRVKAFFRNRDKLPDLKPALLALVLAILWYWPSSRGFTPQEQALWDRVRSAQHYVAAQRRDMGIRSLADSDPWDLGLIGVPWSPYTTTQGDLGAKRTACNPAWAVQFTRWFARAGLAPGDRVALFSSGSFPGLLVNALMASEAMDLDLLLVVSLGSSSYGANHPALPWPVLHRMLRTGGFVRKKADYYTLGGNRETGQGMLDEGRAILAAAAREDRVRILTAPSLAAMVRVKSGLVRNFDPGLFINIGGSHANLGSDDRVLHLGPGLSRSAPGPVAGNGVLGFAASQDLPCIHMLDIKALALKQGIPFDRAPRPGGFRSPGIARSLLGALLFFGVLSRCRRWRLGPFI